MGSMDLMGQASLLYLSAWLKLLGHLRDKLGVRIIS